MANQDKRVAKRDSGQQTGLRQKPYQLLEHTADIRIRVHGRTLEDLFQKAAYAISDTLVEAETIQPVLTLMVQVQADNLEGLFVHFLSEILFLFDAKHFVVRKVSFDELEEKKITATAWGETFSPDRHHPKTEIKAITWHQLKVAKEKGDWIAEWVLDV